MKVLLVEPAYKNKYPPMGLMKISTYHKQRGDTVCFFKGNMDQAVYKEAEFDRVYITTLFTFYYKKTLQTIEHYKLLCDHEKIYIGGIMASLLTDKLREDSQIQHIMTGLLTNSEVLGLGDNVNVDELPLDYSILDEIDYEYPAGDNYIAYTTRGCPNHCDFCAVPRLEPNYVVTNNIMGQIRTVNEIYGEKRNLLLLDNNIFNLSVDQLTDLVGNLHQMGFTQQPTFSRTTPFEEYLRKRGNFISDKILQKAVVYLTGLRKCFERTNNKGIYDYLLEQLRESSDPGNFLYRNQEKIRDILAKMPRSKLLKRYVDFNQGLEAARITHEKMAVLSQLPLNPVRIAFDHYNPKAVRNYQNAIEIAHECGINSFSNYMLYNHDDRPEDLWRRLMINVELAREWHLSIFSFPMKYMPIGQTDRTHIGEHWNWKYLQAISAILLVKKGIVACGQDFFFRAFGRNMEEFFEILTMPRDFIIYRNYYEREGLTQRWKIHYDKLNQEHRSELIQVLSDRKTESTNIELSPILGFYQNKYLYVNMKKNKTQN